MSKNLIIVSSVLLALVLIGVAKLVAGSQPRIIGSLPPNEIREIRQVVAHELKDWEFPRLAKDSIHHVGYVLHRFRRYSALRILWIDVKDDRYVRVVAGLGRKTIASDGWDFMVRKHEHWEITGTAYWGSLEVAPKDFRIPPD